MKTEHILMPIFSIQRDNGGAIVDLHAADGELIGSIIDSHAAFIVAAANSHDELVESWKHLLEVIEQVAPGMPLSYEWKQIIIKNARAALAKAEGSKGVRKCNKLRRGV